MHAQEFRLTVCLRISQKLSKQQRVQCMDIHVKCSANPRREIETTFVLNPLMCFQPQVNHDLQQTARPTMHECRHSEHVALMRQKHGNMNVMFMPNLAGSMPKCQWILLYSLQNKSQHRHSRSCRYPLSTWRAVLPNGVVVRPRVDFGQVVRKFQSKQWMFKYPHLHTCVCIHGKRLQFAVGSNMCICVSHSTCGCC